MIADAAGLHQTGSAAPPDEGVSGRHGETRITLLAALLFAQAMNGPRHVDPDAEHSDASVRATATQFIGRLRTHDFQTAADVLTETARADRRSNARTARMEVARHPDDMPDFTVVDYWTNRTGALFRFGQEDAFRYIVVVVDHNCAVDPFGFD